LLFGMGIALAAPGDLDPGFNGSGLFSLTIGDYGSAAFAAVQQSDGKLVLAGDGTLNSADHADFVAVRLTADGTLDGSFSTDGVARANFRDVPVFGGSYDLALAVIQQTDGKLVLAGTTAHVFGDDDIALARFNADGTLDSTFGDGGLARLDIGSTDDVAFSLIQQDGDKLVIAGTAISGGFYRQVFARFNANGTLDTTFGTGGTTLTDFGEGSGSWTSDIAQQPDGKLVAIGQVSELASRDFSIVRLSENGVLDPLFDGDGILAVDFDGNEDIATTVALQADGAIVAAGFTTSTEGRVSAALLRVNADGSPDNSFGIAGKAVIDMGGQSLLNSIAVQADGRLIATGTRFGADGGQHMILARFNSDGALDTSYGIDGVATADFGTGDTAHLSTGVALIQQADGKYVAAGPNSLGTFGAARFDDGAAFPGRIGLTVTSQTVDETTAMATYAVRRTGGRTGAVSVNYATAAGQAQPGSDFEDASGTLTWNDGDADDKTLTINIIDDAVAESSEDFSLTLSAPTGGGQLAASEATTSIANDDGPGELYFPNGLDQIQVEEAATAINARVRRRDGSTGAVSVKYSTSSGTAGAGTDFVATSGTLTWADGDTSDKMVDVGILDDGAAEGDEDFQIRLSNPTGGATIPFLGGVQLMRIVDNDAGLGLADSAASIGEAGGSVSLAVSRSGPAGAGVSVNYATSSGSATTASDFTGASGTLNWAAGDSADKTILVIITNDMKDEIDETFTVTLSNPSGGTALGSNSSTTVTIIDDDAPAGGSNSGSGGGGALDWLVLLFLTCLTFQRGCPARATAVQSR
jgi:uncharacterized delta-60 repeat protein